MPLNPNASVNPFSYYSVSADGMAAGAVAVLYWDICGHLLGRRQEQLKQQLQLPN